MKTTTQRSFLLLLLLANISLAQIGIGTTTPNGALDVTSATDGLLIPRIALSATNVATVTTPTISELVYNTTTSAVGPNQVTPGYYYWDGMTWIRLAVGAFTNDWALTGNAGTVAGTNFIGTTDAIDVRIKTNGTDRWNISNANNGQLQSYSLGTAPIPTYSFQTDTNTGIFSPSADAIGFSTFGIERARIDASGRLVVGAGTANAMLDINSANEGLLIPRIALTATNSALPLTTPTNSEMVFNTANAGIAPNNVTPGYYYWGGISWIRLATGTNSDWALTGNSGTVAGTNFIGTTDAVDVRLKTNGTDRWNISNANNGQLQSYALGTAALPVYSFQTDSNTGIFSSNPDNLDFATNGVNRLRIPNADQVHALALGTALLPFYSFSADSNTGIFSPAADVLSMSTNGVEGWRMGTTSNVSIGATYASTNAAPANGLRVQGAGVFGKASGEDSRDVVSAHTSATSYSNFTGYPNATARRAFAGYADGGGIGLLGSSNNAGYGIVGLTKPGALSPFIKGNEGVVGQADGANTATIPVGIHGLIDETAAGNWKAVGILGENNNITPGFGFNGGAYNSANQGAISGVYGNIGSRVPTANIGQNSYMFGVVGDILTVGSGTSIPDTSGGVLGFGGNGNFGMLGYRGASGIFYSVYGGGAIGGIALLNNGNRMASGADRNRPNNHIGIGITGGFMGGYIAGQEYGMFSHGREFGAYVQGKTIVNEPIVKLTDTGSAERTATYVPTSTEIDVMTRGRGQLQNGTVFVPFKKNFSQSVGDAQTINVTVTPTQETKGVFVSRVTPEGFYVTENGSGASNASFNWVAVGTQKGFENGVEISDTVKSRDFDQKMVDMINSENQKEGTSIQFDGNRVRFERLQESNVKSARKEGAKK